MTDNELRHACGKIHFSEALAMKTAQPKIPAKTHRQMKAEAKKRGRHVGAFYADVIKAGLTAIHEQERNDEPTTTQT